MKYNGNLYGLYKYLSRFGSVSLIEADLFIYKIERDLLFKSGTPSCRRIVFDLEDAVPKSILKYRTDVFEMYFKIIEGNIQLKQIDFEVEKLDYDLKHSIYGDTSKMSRKIIESAIDELSSANNRLSELSKFFFDDAEKILKDGRFTEFNFLDILKDANHPSLYKFYSEQHCLSETLSRLLNVEQ